MTQPTLVWRFEDAPQEFRDLSPHGGDEDWLAVCPDQKTAEDITNTWAQSGGNFGCCDVSSEVLSDGRVVLIGAHS